MSRTFSGLIPKPLKRTLKKIITGLWRIILQNGLDYLGWARYCPVCREWVRSFEPFGVVPRPDARCPACGSLERHRLAWAFFEGQTNLFDGSPKSMLHIAPEGQFEERLRQVPGIEYLTADLHNPRAMVKMDITDIQYPDNSFDVIYCSHVLEHVPDDRKAMSELRRVLKADGWALILVPVTAEKTFEAPSVTDPAQRERLLGQYDHVRRYGPDFENRLEEAGFTVTRICSTDIMSMQNIVRLGVQREEIFLCHKRKWG